MRNNNNKQFRVDGNATSSFTSTSRRSIENTIDANIGGRHFKNQDDWFQGTNSISDMVESNALDQTVRVATGQPGSNRGRLVPGVPLSPLVKKGRRLGREPPFWSLSLLGACESGSLSWPVCFWLKSEPKSRYTLDF
jgi:hypothetical protein